MTFKIEDLQWKDGVALARTREGSIARILSVKGSRQYPILGEVPDRAGFDTWHENGRWGASDRAGYLDLVECLPPEKVKIKVEFWVNVFPNGRASQPHDTKEIAGRVGLLGARIACLHIVREVEEGEGL